MTNDIPPSAVLVQVKEIKERCGKCNQPFSMELYLEPSTEKKHFRVLCNGCNITVKAKDPLEEEDY